MNKTLISNILKYNHTIMIQCRVIKTFTVKLKDFNLKILTAIVHFLNLQSEWFLLYIVYNKPIAINKSINC